MSIRDLYEHTKKNSLFVIYHSKKLFLLFVVSLLIAYAIIPLALDNLKGYETWLQAFRWFFRGIAVVSLSLAYYRGFVFLGKGRYDRRKNVDRDRFLILGTLFAMLMVLVTAIFLFILILAFSFDWLPTYEFVGEVVGGFAVGIVAAFWKEG